MNCRIRLGQPLASLRPPPGAAGSLIYLRLSIISTEAELKLNEPPRDYGGTGGAVRDRAGDAEARPLRGRNSGKLRELRFDRTRRRWRQATGNPTCRRCSRAPPDRG